MRPRKALIVAASVLLVLCWVHGVIYHETAARAGGFTHHGKVANGRYFLGNHGDYTEVSPDEWRQRKFHERLASISWWVGVGSFAAIGLALRQRKAA